MAKATELDVREQELWRDVPGFEGYYKVSNHGRVWSNHSGRGRKPRMLSGGRDKRGYIRVDFRSPERSLTTRYLHRVVMRMFVGECPEGQEVRHLDGNPGNNCLSNLKYGTHTENIRDRDRHGRTAKGERGGRAKLTETDVRQIRIDASAGVFQAVLARIYGVSQASISDIVRRTNWKHVA